MYLVAACRAHRRDCPIRVRADAALEECACRSLLRHRRHVAVVRCTHNPLWSPYVAQVRGCAGTLRCSLPERREVETLEHLHYFVFGCVITRLRYLGSGHLFRYAYDTFWCEVAHDCTWEQRRCSGIHIGNPHCSRVAFLLEPCHARYCHMAEFRTLACFYNLARRTYAREAVTVGKEALRRNFFSRFQLYFP